MECYPSTGDWQGILTFLNFVFELRRIEFKWRYTEFELNLNENICTTMKLIYKVLPKQSLDDSMPIKNMKQISINFWFF